MRVDLFDFNLPREAIALRPVVPRDAARLLAVRPGQPPADHRFIQLPKLLHRGDLLVFNDTRVIAAQLHGQRMRPGASAAISLTLHQRIDESRWMAFAKPARRLKPGDRIDFGGNLAGTVTARGGHGDIELAFEKAGADLDAAIAKVGHVPLPPYISSRRSEDARDLSDYQTTYARHNGAVAAPTAGLHFTDRIFTALKHAGIQWCFVTLHVGAGTFLPVKVEDTADHHMHRECGVIDAPTARKINEARARGSRLVSVGTTSLRLLESAAAEDGTIRPWSGPTDIFITPGYRFRAIDGLITNFHLPRSTLFMLVSALCGIKTMKKAYDHAVAGGYRFYSYGDASLLWKPA